MSTFRVVKDSENPYVMINKHFIYDSSISFKAKGILLYIFSRPDDWKIYEKEIVKHSKDSKDSVRTGIKELLDAGYMTREKSREQGKFKGYDYDVYEFPQLINRSGKSGAEKPKTENPKTENPPLLNKEGTKELKELNNELNSTTTKEANAFSVYEQNFGMLKPLVIEDINYWIDQLNEELVIESMKIAVKRNKTSFGYCEGILKSWINNNVKTLNDVQALALRNEKPAINVGTHKKQNGGKQNGKSQYENLF